MLNENNAKLSLIDLCKVLFRYKILVFTVFSATLITVTAGVYLMTETYEATAVLLIKLGRENVSPPPAMPSTNQIISMGVQKEDINSEIEIINSRANIEKVLQKYGINFLAPDPPKPKTIFQKIKYELKRLYKAIKKMSRIVLIAFDLIKDITPHEKIILSMQKALQVQQVRGSNVIKVQFRWGSPYIAKEVLNSLIAFYLEHHLNLHKTSGEYDFLQKQVQIIKERLYAAENSLHDLENKEDITFYDKQKGTILDQLAEFTATLKRTETELAVTQTETDALNNQLYTKKKSVELSQTVIRNPRIDDLKEQLLELELEKKKLGKKFKKNSRPVILVNEEIQKINATLAESSEEVIGSTKTGINTVFKEVEKNLLFHHVNLLSLSKKKEVLQEHITSCKQDLQRLNSYKNQIQRLNRRIKQEENNFQFYQKKLEEARITEMLDLEKMVNVRVIDPATAGFKPVKPKKLLLIGISALLGLFGGIGLAFSIQYFDHSIISGEDVAKHLNLPLLATIDESPEFNLP